MDYGKLAYMKADELESRISAVSPSRAEEKYAYALFEPKKEISEGIGYDMTYIRGGNTMTVTVKTVLDVISGGKLVLKINGLTAGELYIDSAGKVSEIFLNTILTDGNSIVRLEAGEGFCGIVLRAEISLAGKDAYINKTASDFCVDEDGGVLGFIRTENEQLFIGFCPSSAPYFHKGINLGFGNRCDIVAFNGRFYAVYCDSFLNLWGLIYEPDGTEISRQVIGRDFDAVSIAIYNNAPIIAVLKSGKAGYIVTASDFSSASGVQFIDLAVIAENIKLIKNPVRPSLVVIGDGKSYLKPIEEEQCCGLNSAIKIKVNLEGVNV